MKTTFIRIESEDELPVGVVRNTTRPNLFGYLYTDTESKNLEVKTDIGILGNGINVALFKEILDNGFVELLNMKEIEYVTQLGKYVFKRNKDSDVTVYYINTSSEKKRF